MTLSPVLVVDDDPSIVSLVQKQLEFAGLEVCVATTGVQAVALMKENLFRVVLADINMPGMDGLKMICALKKISPLVQVVFLTAHASLDRAIDCIDRGACDILSKASDWSLIIPSVLSAMERCARWMTFLNNQAVVPTQN